MAEGTEVNEEEELIPVGEGVEEKTAEREDEDDERSEASEDSEERGEEEAEEGDESRLGASEEEDEGEAKREKRRDERRTRKQRQREARDRDQQELTFQKTYIDKLVGRVEELEGRVGHSEVNQVDGRIQDLKSKLKLADQVISKAVTQNDGEAMVEAQGIRDNLRDSLSQLEGAKTSMTQERPVQEQLDPRLASHAASWMSDHGWWDPNGADPDSRKVSQLDAKMVKEGWDPTSPEYWEELSDRVEEALPERYAKSDPKPKPKAKAKGPTFSTGGRERPLKKNEVYISPERKEAMMEAGVWDDPEQRQKYLRSYATYDREASNA